MPCVPVACLLPDTPGNRRGRPSRQAQKNPCFGNFSENFTPASITGHAMHPIPPRWPFSKAWEVTNCQQQHFSSQSVSRSCSPPPGMVWMTITDLLSSGQSYSIQQSLSLLLALPLLPSSPHWGTLWGPQWKQTTPGDFVALSWVRSLGLRDVPAVVGRWRCAGSYCSTFLGWWQEQPPLLPGAPGSSPPQGCDGGPWCPVMSAGGCWHH